MILKLYKLKLWKKKDIKLKFKLYCRQHCIDEVDEDIVNDYMFHNNLYGNNIFTMLLNTNLGT